MSNFQQINQHSAHIKELCTNLEELAYQKRILVSGYEQESKKQKLVERLVIKESLHLREDEKCAPGCHEIENEYCIASKLSHDHILSPLQYKKQYRGGCAIVFPRASCDAFHYFIERSQREKANSSSNQTATSASSNGGAMYTLSEVRVLLKQIASALHYLHNGENVAHNDVKLENFLCFIPSDKNENPTFMLTDFGYSYEIQSEFVSDSQDTSILDSSFSASQSTAIIQESQKNINVYPKWKNRVKRYLSPELIEGMNRKSIQMGCEKEGDIISLGFALFTLVFFDQLISHGEREYSTSKKYKRIQKEGTQFLQTLNCKIIDTEPERKDELFNLILSMIDEDPVSRIDATGILNHSWLN